MTQAAWAASKTKKTYLKAQFGRIARRRGKKRAAIAVGHSILIIAYHVLQEMLPYHELGEDYFDRMDPDRLTRYLVRRLATLGHHVKLQPAIN